MKIKKGFLLRKVAENYCVVAVGEASKSFRGVINLNGSGAYLFELLLKGATFEELNQKMHEKYDASDEQITQDINNFINVLKEYHILDE